MKNKVYDSTDSVVADVSDGATIMFGGFGGTGFPNGLIRALAKKGTKNIHAISNNCGTDEFELGLLFKNRRDMRGKVCQYLPIGLMCHKPIAVVRCF